MFAAQPNGLTQRQHLLLVCQQPLLLRLQWHVPQLALPERLEFAAEVKDVHLHVLADDSFHCLLCDDGFV